MSKGYFKVSCALVLGVLMLGCSSPRYQGPTSDHFDGKKFFNPDGEGAKGFLALMRWQLLGTRKDWPKSVEIEKSPWAAQSPDGFRERITFVNHATVLLELKGLNVITDPVFSERASPITWAGPKRVKPVGLMLDQLPKIDVVLISHNHYDHLDIKSLQALQKKDHPLVLAPLGDCKVIHDEAKEVNCVEMDWWQAHDFKDVKITFTPTHHWSARGMTDRNKSLWGGYVIERADHKIYFGGDTGFSDHFGKTQEKFGSFDWALLPIGAYEPRWFMKEHHMNPEEAVRAHQIIKAKRSLAIHFGTFRLTDESYEEPILHLQEAKQKLGVADTDFIHLENGFSVWMDDSEKTTQKELK